MFREESRAPTVEVETVGQLVAGGHVCSTDQSIKITNHFEVRREQPPMLTALQRKNVADKVGEVVQATNLTRFDIYRVVLAECGFERMDDVPRQYYGEVMGMLDTMIKRAGTEQPADEPAKPRPRFANRWTVSLAISGAAMITSLAGTSRAQDEPGTCSIAGTTYSVGSIAVMADRFVRECREEGGEVRWRELESTP